MNRHSFLVVTLAALASGPLPAREAVRKDLAGDPLPPGALARMGTVRLRSEVPLSCVAFSPDGKELVTAGQSGKLTFWDVATGKATRTLTTAATWVYSLGFSRDGKVLALGCNNGTARLIDPHTGAEKASLHDPLSRSTGALATLSPDGKTVVMANNHTRQFVLWDVQAGSLKHRVKHDNHVTPPLVFTSDSKQFVTAWTDGRLHLVDAATARSVRNLEPKVAAGGHRYTTRIAALALTPDDRQVIYRLATDRFLNVLDLATAKVVRRWQRTREPVYSSSGTLALTPDGRVLLEASGDPSVRVWAVASGKLLRELPAPGLAVHRLALSADGKHAAAVSSNAVYLWAVATGKQLHAGTGHQTPIGKLAFTPDGKKLLSIGSSSLRLWEASTGRQLRSLGHRLPHAMSHLAIGGGGKSVRWVDADRALYEWKFDTDRPTRLTTPRDTANFACQAVSPDGKRLAGIRSTDRKLRLVDLAGGKADRELAVVPGAYSNLLVFSPDGRTLALSSYQDKVVTLFDTASGSVIRKLMPIAPTSFAPAITFAPDGRSLLKVESDPRIVERVSGGERLRLPRETFGYPNDLAWSADGRLVARAQPDGVVMVYDTFTGQEIFRRDTGQGAVNAVAFSRDGRRLATGGVSSTVVVWQLPAVEKPRLLDAKKAWEALEDNDATNAFRAIASLVSQPDETIALFRTRLKPRPPADAKRIAQLIKDLDDDVFAVREKASEELAELGRLAEEALKKAAKGPSIEVRRRAQDLLRKLRGAGDVPPDRLRLQRAVEVLERIGSPAARAVLKKMLEGKLEASLEQSIRDSLARLESAAAPG